MRVGYAVALAAVLAILASACARSLCPREQYATQRVALRALTEQRQAYPFPAPVTSQTVAISEFQVLREIHQETARSAIVMQDILIDVDLAPLSFEEFWVSVEPFLAKRYREAMSHADFEHHASATSVTVYAYTSRHDFSSGMGQWYAMIQTYRGTGEPHFRRNDRFFWP